MTYSPRDRLQDILDLAFGPFPVLTEHELLTELERGLFKQRMEADGLRQRAKEAEDDLLAVATALGMTYGPNDGPDAPAPTRLIVDWVRKLRSDAAIASDLRAAQARHCCRCKDSKEDPEYTGGCVDCVRAKAKVEP
jgi:hypothetical protein